MTLLYLYVLQNKKIQKKTISLKNTDNKMTVFKELEKNKSKIRSTNSCIFLQDKGSQTNTRVNTFSFKFDILYIKYIVNIIN